jgi:hypothetical protein
MRSADVCCAAEHADDAQGVAEEIGGALVEDFGVELVQVADGGGVDNGATVPVAAEQQWDGFGAGCVRV